jgi:hypothetical protein
MSPFRMNPRRRAPANFPPSDFKIMMEEELDENYEIALSEHGVYSYKIVGEVNNADARLPEDFYPGATVVIVGYDGNGYNVYLANVEDVRMDTLARGLPTAQDAELRAKDEMVKMNASSRRSSRPKRKI